jgi:hypothetical protein
MTRRPTVRCDKSRPAVLRQSVGALPDSPISEFDAMDSTPLIMRRTDTDDFQVYEGELHAGRIYRLTSTMTVRWWWGINAERVPLRGRQQGVADTLDESKAAFRAAWEGRNSGS